MSRRDLFILTVLMAPFVAFLPALAWRETNVIFLCAAVFETLRIGSVIVTCRLAGSMT